MDFQSFLFVQIRLIYSTMSKASSSQAFIIIQRITTIPAITTKLDVIGNDAAMSNSTKLTTTVSTNKLASEFKAIAPDDTLKKV